MGASCQQPSVSLLIFTNKDPDLNLNAKVNYDGSIRLRIRVSFKDTILHLHTANVRADSVIQKRLTSLLFLHLERQKESNGG